MTKITPGRGVNNLVDARQREGVLRTSLIDICVVNTQPPLPIRVAHNYRIGQPRRVEHSSHQTCCFQLPNLLYDELLPLQSLLSDLLLDGPRVGADN